MYRTSVVLTRAGESQDPHGRDGALLPPVAEHGHALPHAHAHASDGVARHHAHRFREKNLYIQYIEAKLGSLLLACSTLGGGGAGERRASLGRSPSTWRTRGHGSLTQGEGGDKSRRKSGELFRFLPVEDDNEGEGRKNYQFDVFNASSLPPSSFFFLSLLSAAARRGAARRGAAHSFSSVIHTHSPPRPPPPPPPTLLLLFFAASSAFFRRSRGHFRSSSSFSTSHSLSQTPPPSPVWPDLLRHYAQRFLPKCAKDA